MYTVDASGKRVYTLKKVVGSEVTKSAHPARFSPDDKFSRSVYRTCLLVQVHSLGVEVIVHFNEPKTDQDAYIELH